MTAMESSYLASRSELSLKSGEDYTIEQEAADWLAKSREGVRALKDKRDWLSKDQLQLRAQREILNLNGVADESLVSGLFRRAFNPLAGSRPTRRMHAHDE